jgi:predicted nicotinamide N-methyase
MDEDDFGSIGFMFDAEHHRVTKKVDFNNGLIIDLRLIGEDPGHVQSGQYLWPAAISASQHIIDNWINITNIIKNYNDPTCNIKKNINILELGAGCGLAGLVSSKLSNINRVIFTDYDPGSLQLIQENVDEDIKSNKYCCHCYNKDFNDIINNNYFTEENKKKCQICKNEVNFVVEFLEWGTKIPIAIDQCFNKLDSNNDSSNNSNIMTDNLIIGTDLLYCSQVVSLLLNSVSQLLNAKKQIIENSNNNSNNNSNSVDLIENNRNGGLFILVSSFDIGKVILNYIFHFI